MKSTCGLIVLAIALIPTSCSAPSPPMPESAARIPALWSYAGDSGPAHWDKLDAEYANCGYGTTQSPVDIANAMPEDLPNIAFHYRPARLKIRNTGHAIAADVDSGNSIDVNEETYDLVQILFHVPSEHRIRGKLADAEIQLVHRNAAGQLAVVAVLLHAGREDTVLRDVWNNLSPIFGPGKTIEGTIDLEGILPHDRRTYRYEGSETTPPCAEVVTWLVMREAMHVGPQQLADFTRIFSPNNRPVQPLNHRIVVEDTSMNR